jgi:hypothetical protein
MDPSLSVPPFGEAGTYSDVGPHHEIDMDRPYHEGLDDFQRPTLDCECFFIAISMGLKSVALACRL